MKESSKHVPWILALEMFVIGTTSLSILGLGPALTRDLAVGPIKRFPLYFALSF